MTHRLYDSGVWSKATYSLIRGSVPLDVEVVLVPAERSMNDWLRLIALIYLGIGLYVSAAALDCGRLDAFLHLLPGLVCFLLAALHRQVQRFRLERALGK